MISANSYDIGSFHKKFERLVAPATIFLGACLLFAVEPLIAKAILPWFGGSAAVWLACLLFFQGGVLAGYLYAHILTQRFSVSWQMRIHIALLATSLLVLPILPAAHWKPTGGENPLPAILGLLAATIGLPFLLLSATTSLITAWRQRSDDFPTPLTRLYALSNLGSMLALLSYPVLIEPLFSIHTQATLWSCLYLCFAVLAAMTAWRARRAMRPAPQAAAADETRPNFIIRLLWFLLALAGSALLLSMTNHILRNIAAIPLLWIVPLALYLLSFVIVFESPRWYRRPLWLGLFAIMAGAMIYEMVGLFLADNFVALLLFHAAGLFVCCMACHGELAALKPAARHLTAYYLSIAAGGACGGLFVAVIAPWLLRVDIDLALILPLTVLMVFAAAWRHWPARSDSFLASVALAAFAIAWVADTGRMAQLEIADIAQARFIARNFYGALRVLDQGPTRALQNGNIIHGREFLAADRAGEPVSYYGRQSGLGLALEALGRKGPVRVGAIGLGAGTIAAYGRAGDNYAFYEINPAVRQIAGTYFRFLALCRARWHIVMGDARLSLERETVQGFDLLAVDAFTSDSIPMHLLTREAFALYARHLKAHGVLAVHVTNKYIDLAPVVALSARHQGWTARRVASTGDARHAIEGATWILVTADPLFFAAPALAQAKPIVVPRSLAPWTDDHSNLWQSLLR